MGAIVMGMRYHIVIRLEIWKQYMVIYEYDMEFNL